MSPLTNNTLPVLPFVACDPTAPSFVAPLYNHRPRAALPSPRTAARLCCLPRHALSCLLLPQGPL